MESASKGNLEDFSGGSNMKAVLIILGIMLLMGLGIVYAFLK